MEGFIKILLRGSILLWTLLITALIGNVIANNRNAAGSAEAAVNFTMFVAALSWIAGLVGLAGVFVSFLARPLLALPLDGLATLFTFIAAIVLAAKSRAVDCGNIGDRSSSWIGYGSGNDAKRCREIEASTAFMWFLWASFMGVLFFVIRDARGGGSFSRSSRSSRPNMSQVGV
jgi:hypothetical protein